MRDQDSFEAALITNYNETGQALIQKMFRDGYLSPRGADATNQLLELVKPSRDDRMLDASSGLGGAAFRVAEHP